jgi:1-acyl-sn-glycerol-3-phosphate acyltransferase
MMSLMTLLVIPVYKNKTLEWRDTWSKRLVYWILSAAHFKINVIDHNNSVEEHSKLYIAPHICMLEAMMLIRCVGHIRPMTAEFTKHLPLFGKMVDASDPIYVKRGKGKKVSVVELFRESLATTPYRHLVFPEGTFTNGHTLIQFKSGAFVLGVPVTPVVYSYEGYTPFWNRDESTFPAQIYRMMARIVTPVTVEFLQTYHPSKEECEDPKLYAFNVRKLLSEHTGRPLSSQALSDSPNYRRDKNTTTTDSKNS